MKKGIFSVLIIFCLLFSVYTMVFSQGNYNKIDVSFRDTALVGKGGKFDLKGETFYYNNKLYAPVSTLVKVIGGEGLLNEKKSEITIRTYKDIPECNPLNGEIFVYGILMSIDFQNRELGIEQYLDDNSTKISSKLKVRDDVIIILERNNNKMNINFNDLNVNDKIGLIFDRFGLVRGIIMSK